MTADSVPAPMVQVPAETVEKLRSGFQRTAKFFEGDDSLIDVVRDFLVAVYAATPAASVPAADILALADEWEAAQRRCCGRKFPCTFHEWRGDDIADLRALVAAAEQADKGEAAYTPRPRTETEHDWACTCADCEADLIRRQHQHSEAFEPVKGECCETCGHSKEWHGSHGCAKNTDPSGPVSKGCPCARFAARVPVNDEAEACDKCNHWHEAQDRCGYCDCFSISHECDNGQANTCRHLSASGLDRTFGPGKVWRCDHCGLCWIEGYSPHDPRAARGEDAP